MSVGFGFSIGDLVTSLKIIKDSIEAVKDTKGAAADYAALATEIASLQDAFGAIEDIQSCHKGTEKQQAAIDRAIGACQKCVEDFLVSISKYQSHLQPHAKGLTSTYRKIKWALCKKEDVALFRARLERHTSSINMLLITFQVQEQNSSSDQNSRLVVKSQGEKQAQDTLEMLQNLSTEQCQCFEILIRQNRELMRTVQDLNRMLQMQISIPPQVLLQRPVILLDAFGKIAPFHLEFIDSLESFSAVFKIRFRQAGVKQAGLSKIDKQEFAIQDTRYKRVLDLRKPWASLFEPGQEVDMSMVFHRFACPPSTCPGCSRNNEGDDRQTQCQECGLCYQNIQAVKKPFDDEHQASLNRFSIPTARGTVFQYVIQHPGMKPETRLFSPATEPEDEFFSGYRRVQVISQPLSVFQATHLPPYRLEAFRGFVELFTGSAEDDIPYLAEMKELYIRIDEYLLEKCKTPPFSSFSRIKQWQKHLAEELSLLILDIDYLFNIMCNSYESMRLVQYISKCQTSKPAARGYYASRLTDIFNNGNFNDASELATEKKLPVGETTPTKPKSKEQVQWMLLNYKGK